MKGRRKPPHRSRAPLLLLPFLALAVGGIVYLTMTPGNAAEPSVPPQNLGDTFTGTVLSAAVERRTQGVVQADLDCKGPMSAITCRAIINSEDGGRIEFQYTHDMMGQPCLAPQDRVIVEAAPAGGRTVVTRLA